MQKANIQSILNRYLVYQAFLLATLSGEVAWLFKRVPSNDGYWYVFSSATVTLVLFLLATLRAMDYESKLYKLNEHKE